MMRAPLATLIAFAAACGGNGGGPSAADADLTPDATPVPSNPDRDIAATDLSFDLTAMTATAVITLGPATTEGATFETGVLHVDAVTLGGAPIAFAQHGSALDVDVPAAAASTTIAIAYHWPYDPDQGASAGGWTLTWPYYCRNLFPCHSQPADGTRFTLSLSGIPAGQTAVYPTTIAIDAPAYQLAWATAKYQQLDLGTTAAGTRIHAWYFAADQAKAQQGTAHLRAAFDWLEQTLGPYAFGSDYGSVEVAWGGGTFDGMEHHPFSHVNGLVIGDELTHIHEAVHGWFGDGVRIACWEDFVLSEGTVSYLAARAITVTAGAAAGDQVWAGYQQQLSHLVGDEPTWPNSCGQVDVLKGLFNDAPYVRGAYFYRAVALKVGDAQLDHALATFYQRYRGTAAHMSDMLDVIRTDTGYDATACADSWLRSTTIPAPGACP